MPAELHIPQPESDHPAELAMIARLRDNGPALLEAYLAKETKNGVTFIARDAAKRIFPEYKANPTENNRYSDRAASALADAARRRIMSRPVNPQRRDVYIFTGTPASGKSVSGRPIDFETVEIVHETIFTSFDKASLLVREALDAGRSPVISLVYTDDPRINIRRMIDRARRIGRTVPIAFMARTYVELPMIVAKLQDTFDQSLDLLVTDNSGPPGQAIAHADLSRVLFDTGRYTIESCLRAMDHELSQINEVHPIPASILREARLR